MANPKLERLIMTDPAKRTRADIRNGQRLVKEEIRKLENMRAADQMSGAGNPIDFQLRRMLKMINEEVIDGVEIPLPKLFDLVGPFYRRSPENLVPIYMMREEKDHAFDAVDFFAYATLPELRDKALATLREIPEGIIHNFTALGDPASVQFEDDEDDPVVLSGISMIRFGDLLFWQTAGGRVTDLEKMTADRRAEIAANEERIRATNRHASERQLNDVLNPTAERLPGTTDVWNCSAYGLFNLRTEKHEMRATSKEWTVSQAVFSDQFETRYADFYETDETIRRMVDKAMVQIEKDHVFFEVAETALCLPAYFTARVQFVRNEETKTQLGDSSKGGVARKHALKAPLDMRVLLRRVATLDIGPREGYDRSYTPPRYQVEVDGFFRRLDPGAVGRDSEGAPVRGMTWVKKHARWKDRPAKMGVLHLKSTIGAAMAKARAMTRKAGGGEVRLQVG
nr:hypothetical protein [Neorhizobium tomejilense]